MVRGSSTKDAACAAAGSPTGGIVSKAEAFLRSAAQVGCWLFSAICSGVWPRWHLCLKSSSVPQLCMSADRQMESPILASLHGSNSRVVRNKIGTLQQALIKPNDIYSLCLLPKGQQLL